MIVEVRSEKEIEFMRKSGQISAKALKNCVEACVVGANLLDIEKIAMETILRQGGKPSFTTVGDYKWATCLTVNEQLVHGIPKDRVLKIGDLISIDVGAIYEGWHTDTAWSVVVEETKRQADKEKERFLEVGEEALWRGIKQAIDGNFIGDISAAIQETVEKAGFDVSKTLIGHGVGREIHEPPDVPGVGRKGMGLQLQKGMSLAIEVIYAEKKADVFLEDDGWTYTNKDKSWGGLFEMSVIVGEKQAEVLTDWRKV